MIRIEFQDSSEMLKSYKDLNVWQSRIGDVTPMSHKQFRRLTLRLRKKAIFGWKRIGFGDIGFP